MEISIKDLFDKYELLRYVEVQEKDWWEKESDIDKNISKITNDIEIQIKNLFKSTSISLDEIMDIINEVLSNNDIYNEAKEDLTLVEFANHEYIELED